MPFKNPHSHPPFLPPSVPSFLLSFLTGAPGLPLKPYSCPRSRVEFLSISMMWLLFSLQPGSPLSFSLSWAADQQSASTTPLLCSCQSPFPEWKSCSRHLSGGPTTCTHSRYCPPAPLASHALTIPLQLSLHSAELHGCPSSGLEVCGSPSAISCTDIWPEWSLQATRECHDIDSEICSTFYAQGVSVSLAPNRYTKSWFKDM